MVKNRKILEIIAGPNGSGKTTFADMALAKREKALYINSDRIARGLTPNGSDPIAIGFAQYEAGRYMLQAIETMLKSNQSFSFETTFSGKIWTSYIRRAKKSGYKIKIYFVFVRTIELSLKRIRNRVKNGGHDIPENIVRRRFRRTFDNFVNLYAPLADEWYVIDNSKKPIVIAHKKNDREKYFNRVIFEKHFR